MNDLTAAAAEAFRLVITLDPDLGEIVALSLRISLTAVLVAAAIALPLGALLGATRFKGRRALIVLFNALMGLPPVVVGLLVYLMLSRSGPLGVFGLLYTPTAMIIAQIVLVTPIITAITRQTVDDLRDEYHEQLRAFGLNTWQTLPTLLWEARPSLLTALLAGFGRAIAEVGAVLIVGGNIDHLTRVMTTAIALETSKGNLALALGLGLVLMLIAVLVNAAASIASPARSTGAVN
ncbi:MAG: ABC transporter permease subunit [Gammaproteobacteria bacterium]|nr:ABC transporter permease subunit [Gammaproteobacteria bacterium]